MIFYALLQLSASSLFTVAVARTFTITNNCPITIWPAIFTDLSFGNATPNQPTGWEAPSYSQVSFSVPNNWEAGRIWARRNCANFSTNTSPNSCLTGGCNGGLLCDPNSGLPDAPATVAKFQLSTDSTQDDFYAIYLEKGYNLPMRIDNSGGCGVPLCGVDLAPDCPEPIKGPFNPVGYPVGCQSACDAGLQPDPSNSPNCCTGSYNTPATCNPSNIEFYSYFKSNCPKTMVSLFDQEIFTCPSSLQVDYNITFCPQN